MLLREDNQLTFNIQLIIFLVKQFWEVVDVFENHGVTPGDKLTVAAKTLLFLLRMRQGLSYMLLKTLFDIESDQSVHDAFWQLCTIYYHKNNPVAQIWCEPNSNAEVLKRKAFFSSLIETMSPLYKYISTHFCVYWHDHKFIYNIGTLHPM